MVYNHSFGQNNSIGESIRPNGGKSFLYPYARLVDAIGEPLAVEKDYRSSFTDTVGGGNLLDWKYRPLDEIKHTDNTSKLQDIVLNFNGKYYFAPSFTGEIKYQYEKQDVERRNHYSPETYFTRGLINLYTPTGGVANINSAIPYGGILDIDNTNLTSHSFRFQLNYNKIWGKNALNAIAGNEIRQSNDKENMDRIYGYNDDVLSYGYVDFVNPVPSYLNLLGGVLLCQLD